MTSAPSTPSGPIPVTINGTLKELPGPMTVGALLRFLELGERSVAVERNRVLVPKKRFSEVSVERGDELEIVTFFGGG